MDQETVTLDDALKLLSLPRVIGADEDGVEITAQNGRYGPYLKRGTDNRTLPDEESLFTMTLDEAKALLATPRTRGGGRAAAGPLATLGDDPATGKPLVIKDGRFGPYITDGEFNVTVPRSQQVAEVTLEQAAELLAAKRALGPAKKKTTRRTSTAKKTTTRSTSKSGTKRTTTRKTGGTS